MKETSKKFLLPAGWGRFTFDDLYNHLEGWFGYAMWADTYKFRKKIMRKVRKKENPADDAVFQEMQTACTRKAQISRG